MTLQVPKDAGIFLLTKELLKFQGLFSMELFHYTEKDFPHVDSVAITVTVLRARRLRNRFPTGTRNFSLLHSIHTASGVQLAPCLIGTRGPIPS